MPIIDQLKSFAGHTSNTFPPGAAGLFNCTYITPLQRVGYGPWAALGFVHYAKRQSSKTSNTLPIKDQDCDTYNLFNNFAFKSMAKNRLITSDSNVEYRVLDARTYEATFEYSNCRVIDPSNRVFKFSLNLVRI